MVTKLQDSWTSSQLCFSLKIHHWAFINNSTDTLAKQQVSIILSIFTQDHHKYIYFYKAFLKLCKTVTEATVLKGRSKRFIIFARVWICRVCFFQLNFFIRFPINLHFCGRILLLTRSTLSASQARMLFIIEACQKKQNRVSSYSNHIKSRCLVPLSPLHSCT